MGGSSARIVGDPGRVYSEGASSEAAALNTLPLNIVPVKASESPHVASPANSRARPGSRLVLGMLVVGLMLALFAVWFQWRQTRRCLDFYGPLAARHIQSAPRVELWEFAGSSAQNPGKPVRRIDITSARGLVHLRRGLVEDANFTWPPLSSPVTEDAAWDLALAFFEADIPTAAGTPPEPGTLLLIDFARSPDRGGRVAIAGRPQAVGLGRLHRGLWRWLEETRLEETRLGDREAE
jgi:hypothetical protein